MDVETLTRRPVTDEQSVHPQAAIATVCGDNGTIPFSHTSWYLYFNLPPLQCGRHPHASEAGIIAVLGNLQPHTVHNVIVIGDVYS
jgi:hypothetical protein